MAETEVKDSTPAVGQGMRTTSRPLVLVQELNCLLCETYLSTIKIKCRQIASVVFV